MFAVLIFMSSFGDNSLSIISSATFIDKLQLSSVSDIDYYSYSKFNTYQKYYLHSLNID